MIKFTISKEQRQHFEKFHSLELEGVFDSAYMSALKTEIAQMIAKFPDGRDLWRHGPLAKKVALDKRLPELMSELTGEKVIRLGYDQFLSSNHVFGLRQKASIIDISCIQGVIGGAVLCLNALALDVAYEPDSIFPKQEGNIVLFGLKKEIDFSELQKRHDQKFLFIAYADKRAVYIHNEKDAYLHNFKNLGYGFGDRLSDQLNPILFRQ